MKISDLGMNEAIILRGELPEYGTFGPRAVLSIEDVKIRAAHHDTAEAARSRLIPIGAITLTIEGAPGVSLLRAGQRYRVTIVIEPMVE